MFEPYSSCPCGSGKKFKWCCQPIHTEITKVFALDEQGQHEAALRLMDQVAAQHPTNPEVWGRKAQLLFSNEKPADAEATLDKAFELNPNYAFGHFLKARFRLFEGEIAGALLLFRKATDLYDPAAADLLAQIHIEIFECEMKLNHPIAARAAADLAGRYNPANENIRKDIDTVFAADNPNLPASAVRKYEFHKLPASAPPERRAEWEAALLSAATGRLTDALKAFEHLTQAENAEAAAWYNLALAQAWLGLNAAAVAALERYVVLEPDEAQAAQAWTLAEVLRFGQGMEDQADVVEHSMILALRDPNAFVQSLAEFERDRLIAGVRVNEEEGSLAAMLLDPPGPALTPELQARQSPKLGAYFMMVGNIVRLWNVNREALDRSFTRVSQKVTAAIGESRSVRGPARFHDVLSDGLTIAINATSKEDAAERLRDGFVKHLEEHWIHRPLKSLGGVTPIDAAAPDIKNGTLRKKLRGVVEFLRECGTLAKFPIDFDRLLRKLGLLEGAAATTVAAPGATRDYAAMSAAEVASLQTATLSPGDLEQAYQAALKLDAKELAGKFAADLVSRPPYPERPDRFPLFHLLINQALAQTDTTTALDRVNEGEKDDCENNGGNRRNDYELRRAQVNAKAGNIDEAEAVFDRLIARVPTEMNVRVAAVETMLSARQSAKARKFAEQGMAEAVRTNNRGLEGHFKELLAAAQK